MLKYFTELLLCLSRAGRTYMSGFIRHNMLQTRANKYTNSRNDYFNRPIPIPRVWREFNISLPNI